MYAWANGAHLAKAIEDTGLAAGDFVRWAKQVLDALDQLRTSVPWTRSSAPAVKKQLRRYARVVALDV